MGNKTIDDFQQSGLAASARADDADELVLADGKIYVRESFDLRGVVFDGFLKAFRDPLDLNHDQLPERLSSKSSSRSSRSSPGLFPPPRRGGGSRRGMERSVALELLECLEPS